MNELIVARDLSTVRNGRGWLRLAGRLWDDIRALPVTALDSSTSIDTAS
jgi:hypothetical protein